MADDIVDRLYCPYADPPCEQCTFCAARAEIERLRSAIDGVLEAIDNAGPVIGHHTWIVVKHRKEWPTLWKAIDQLREARRG